MSWLSEASSEKHKFIPTFVFNLKMNRPYIVNERNVVNTPIIIRKEAKHWQRQHHAFVGFQTWSLLKLCAKIKRIIIFLWYTPNSIRNRGLSPRILSSCNSKFLSTVVVEWAFGITNSLYYDCNRPEGHFTPLPSRSVPATKRFSLYRY